MNDATPARWQFSLLELFVATTALAAGLGIWHLVAPDASLSWQQAGAAIVGGWIAVWETCRAGRTAWKERLSVARSLGHVALILYLPFGWLFVIDYPWSDYHWQWIAMLPVLPGFLPGALLHPIGDGLEFFVMGVATLLMLSGFAWLARLRIWGFMATTLIGVAVAAVSSAIAYGCFLM